MQEPEWRYYRARGGGQVVRDEIRKALGKDLDLVARLQGLMDRIRTNQTLPRDVKSLGKGLYEARLSVQGNEWRLFYALRHSGLVLLALHFSKKKARSIPQAIQKARDRLSDWDKRV